jgi:hypothetical protein
LPGLFHLTEQACLAGMWPPGWGSALTSALRSFIDGNCLPGERITAGSRPLTYCREFNLFFCATSFEDDRRLSPFAIAQGTRASRAFLVAGGVKALRRFAMGGADVHSGSGSKPTPWVAVRSRAASPIERTFRQSILPR